MPTVTVPQELLYRRLGIQTEEEVDQICFEIGTELDDVTTEKAIIRKERHLSDDVEENEEVIFKIEVPANRYDLLWAEGIIRAFRVFRGIDKIRPIDLAQKTSPEYTITVKPETGLIRPFLTAAVVSLSGSVDERLYKLILELQEKLHHTVCRERTLVAIGVHDLDTLQGPFSYEALPPSQIKFVPLKQNREFTGEELMELYKSDSKLKKYLHIIQDSPVFPVIFDSKRRVVSLPPIINGSHSAVSYKTKKLLIECTGTDLTKAKVVLNTLVSMLSEFAEEIVAVEVVEQLGRITKYPDLTPRSLEVDVSYISSTIGVSLEASQVVELLSKMQLPSSIISGSDDKKIQVSVPVTRSDVLHPCDVVEDVAIAYGYNNIPKTRPKTCSQGRQQPLNETTDQLRLELAMAGYTEVLNWVLVSRKANFSMLNRKDDGRTAVVVRNPRGSDFEVLRTSLLPGILKVMEQNKDFPRPVKIFEISDVVRLDPSKDVGASNARHLGALYSGSQKADLQIIHHLLDKIMTALSIPPGADGYTLLGGTSQISSDPVFFGSQQAEVFWRGSCVGAFGVIHPKVLANFTITYPCCYLELDLESLLCV